MNTCIFTNDNNVSISLINHQFSKQFAERYNHEDVFRKINTFLINAGIITGNIIDLGAWIGDNSIPWSMNIKGLIYSIDPSLENCEFIKKMCVQNNINNIKVIQSAISDKTETLSTNDESINHCSFVYENPGTNGKIKVEAVSLDYLFEKAEIENIGYIHLDVEGMEYKIIMGSEELINKNRPIISFEQHLEIDDFMEIINHLNSKRYVVLLIDEVLRGCRPDCRNFIAFPNEKYNYNMVSDLNSHCGRPVFIL